VRLARRCKEIFLLIWGSTASGVRPSVECFRRTEASAPPTEFLPAPKIFLQKRLSHKGYPLYGQNHFWTGFCQRGHEQFSESKSPPYRGVTRSKSFWLAMCSLSRHGVGPLEGVPSIKFWNGKPERFAVAFRSSSRLHFRRDKVERIPHRPW
jgi:hypothetical protein